VVRGRQFFPSAVGVGRTGLGFCSAFPPKRLHVYRVVDFYFAYLGKALEEGGPGREPFQVVHRFTHLSVTPAIWAQKKLWPNPNA